MDSDTVVTYTNLLKRDSDDSEALAMPTLKKHKEIDVTSNDLDIKSEIIKKLQTNSDLLEISLKKMDDMSNRLKVVTDFVEKQKVDSDLPVTSLKEKETPKEKVVDYTCCFETDNYEMINRRTIFVTGFDCSLALDDIKSKLTELFSSCGEVSRVYTPYHCKTGSSIGFAFIDMRNDEKEALKLNGTRLGGMCLLVTMACRRIEYNGFPNHHGCERCHINVMKRRMEIFYRPTSRFPDRLPDSHLGPITTYK